MGIVVILLVEASMPRRYTGSWASKYEQSSDGIL